MWFLGKSRGTNIVDKAKALQSLNTTKGALDQLYGILTVLDTKATGLLTVDTLVIAILASGEYMAKTIKVIAPPLVLEIQLALAALSAFLCLLVVRVSWRFLGEMPNSPATDEDCDRELRSLANVIDDRTHYYWLAWLLALGVFVLTLAWWSWWFAAVMATVVVVWSIGRG